MITRTFAKISTIRKNKKYILNKIKRDNSYNYFLRKKIILKNKQKILNDELGNNSELLKSFSYLNEKRNIIKKENESLKLLYNVTKKLYRQDVDNIFFKIVNHYKNNKYNVTDSSLKKNIFNRTPLLLKDKELENYYLDFKFNKVEDDIIQKQKKKHILFLNKETECLLNIINFLKEEKLKNNKIKFNNEIKKALSHDNLNINKIKNLNMKLKNNLNNIDKNNLNKVINNTLNKEINNNILNSVKIEKKYKKIEKKKIILKDELKNSKKLIKNLSEFNNFSNNKNKIISNLEIKKDFSLLSTPSYLDSNLISKIDNKLKKNSNINIAKIDIKNNKDKEVFISPNIKSDITPKNNQDTKNNNNSPLIKNSLTSESKLKDLEKRRKIYQINIKKLIKNSNNKEILKYLMKQKSQTKFLEKLQTLNILFFSQKELEEIIEYYCREFLGFNINQIKNILTAKNSDIDMEILNLINTFVRKNNRIRANKNIKKENNLLSYNIIKDIDNKAFILQKALIKNQANDD